MNIESTSLCLTSFGSRTTCLQGKEFIRTAGDQKASLLTGFRWDDRASGGGGDHTFLGNIVGGTIPRRTLIESA